MLKTKYFLNNLNDVFSDVDTFFRNGAENNATHDGEQRWYPHYYTREEKTHYEVEIELPGVLEADVDLNVKEGELHISAERKREEVEKNEDGKEEKKLKTFLKYSDRFRLPDDVDIEKIDAEYKNGLLTVHIPKEEKKIIEKKIELKK